MTGYLKKTLGPRRAEARRAFLREKDAEIERKRRKQPEDPKPAAPTAVDPAAEAARSAVGQAVKR
jgi:hypothetical protein